MHVFSSLCGLATLGYLKASRTNKNNLFNVLVIWKDHLFYSSAVITSSPALWVGGPGLKQQSDRGEVPDFSASETELMALPNSGGTKQLQDEKGL